MAGLCSRHQHYEPSCDLCQSALSVSKSLLPTSQQIEGWSDVTLKVVHRLLFKENVDPSLYDDTKEDVDNYMYAVKSEYEKRGLND